MVSTVVGFILASFWHQTGTHKWIPEASTLNYVASFGNFAATLGQPLGVTLGQPLGATWGTLWDHGWATFRVTLGLL